MVIWLYSAFFFFFGGGGGVRIRIRVGFDAKYIIHIHLFGYKHMSVFKVYKTYKCISI